MLPAMMRWPPLPRLSLQGLQEENADGWDSKDMQCLNHQALLCLQMVKGGLLMPKKHLGGSEGKESLTEEHSGAIACCLR
jgi:hypothetical protein